MSHHNTPKVPDNVHNKFINIIRTIKSFCNDKLNDEYYDLSLKLAVKLARKRPSPLSSGQASTWSAGIVHTLGMVNFLFDKSQKPHVRAQEIAEWFDLSQSTISTKSKSIRDMLKISQLDLTWTLPSRIDDHPMVLSLILGMHLMIFKLKPLMPVLYLISQVIKSIDTLFCVTVKVP